MTTPSAYDTAPRPERIPPGTPQPLWSVMIPTFNCATLLRQTLASVLAQDPGPDLMHIEVIDDCSTKDDPEAVVREVGKGRVGFFRREKNGGCTENFNTCVMRSRGRLVHILHGDDFVYPTFYRRIEETASAHPDIAGFFVRCFQIDGDSQIETLLWRASEFEKPTRDPGRLPYLNIFQPPGVVIRRSFYETHGAYLPFLVPTSDWEIFLRVIILGGGLALNEPLAAYRVSSSNYTSRISRTGGNIREILQIGEVFAQVVPNFDRRRLLDKASNDAFNMAELFRQRQDGEAMQANLALWKEITPWPLRARRRLSRFLRSTLKLDIRFSTDETS